MRESGGERELFFFFLLFSFSSRSSFAHPLFLEGKQNTPLLPPSPRSHTVNQTADKPYYFFDGYAHLASGLACGLAGLAAGMAIGVVGDAGVRANAQQPKLFVGMILILIFAEALALYGLIVGIILASKAGTAVPGGGP